MEIVISLALGIGLSAACGFRVFVPLLVMSIASMVGGITFAEGFEWIGSWPALIAFASATALEIGAHYIPWLDNVLETISAPVAVVAGAVITASFIADIDPLLKWMLAVIAGGGVAGGIKLGMIKLRVLSTATTAGAANPVLSTAQAGGSVVLSVFTVILPIFAAIAVLGVIGLIIWKIVRLVRGPKPD